MVGRYRSEELLADWEIVQVGDSLRVQIGSLLEASVVAAPGGGYLAGNIPFRFILQGTRVTGIDVTTRGARGFQLRKDPR